MRGMLGRIEYLEALLRRYGPHESLDYVLAQEMGALGFLRLSDKLELERRKEEDSCTARSTTRTGLR